ncbi:MAG TPA: hypothetical protein VLC46_20220 [Thermoanaerobaculia bacterium]|nr:hypothetical protein [Thermoanaerobaculia bacterium]
MILTNDVQVQLFRQSVIGTAPGTPNGILVPKGSDFDLPFDQKLIKNTQVQADGVQRQSGRGNQTAEGGGGTVVANLNFLPYLTKAWCGASTTTGSSAPYTTISRVTRTTLYYLYEMGLIPLSLFYLYFDQVCSELHFTLQTEGNFEVKTKFIGSGKVNFPGSSTSLDTTPTELTASTADMTALTILENTVDGADTVSLSIDCVSTIVQKRPTGQGGIAKQLAQGEKTVAGKVKFWFESDARWARARAGTITQLKGTVIDIDTNSFEALMTEVELQPTGPKMSDTAGVTQEYAFNSIRKSNLTDTPIKFTHVNTTASYD